jgi:hypothetical protein
LRIAAAGGPLGDSGAARGPTGPVKVVWLLLVRAGADAAAQRLGLVEAVAVISPAATTHAWTHRFWPGLLIVEIGGTPGLLGGHPPQPHALIGEENGGTSQQKLAELQDWIETPALEKEDAAAEQADGGKENVVVAGQRRLEAAHEIEQGAADGQHNADDAGPIEAGIDHRRLTRASHPSGCVIPTVGSAAKTSAGKTSAAGASMVGP